MDNNEERGYGKIVDDLTIADLKKYEEAGISILLVRNHLTPEVEEAVYKSKIQVYADLDPETINNIFNRLRSEAI
jgi:chorismate mutase